MSARGFTLVELMVAMTIAALVGTSLVRVSQALGGAWRVQDETSRLHEHARLARHTITDTIRSAGFHPAPWSTAIDAFGPGTADGYNAHGDRIEVQRRSPTNCFGSANPVTGPNGQPEHHLEINRYFVRSGQLVRQCRYGVDATSLTTQINHLGVVEHVENFQVLYAEDTNADGVANRWVRAGQWQDESRILGVRFAFLLASPGPLPHNPPATRVLLGEQVTPPNDGRLRQVAHGAAMIAGRQ